MASDFASLAAQHTLGDDPVPLIVWNFGEGHQDEFFAAYGIEPDADRIRCYRALWNLES